MFQILWKTFIIANIAAACQSLCFWPPCMRVHFLFYKKKTDLQSVFNFTSLFFCFFKCLYLIFRQKNGGRKFYLRRHSETHFELKNSEFRGEINFWKSLHFPSEKLRISLDFFAFKRKLKLLPVIFVFFLWNWIVVSDW